jgi:hypothetical protein
VGSSIQHTTLRKFITMAVLAAGVTAVSIAQANAESYSGSDLYELCEADMKSAQIYVAGVNDKAVKDEEAALFFIAAAHHLLKAPMTQMMPFIMNYCAREKTALQLSEVVCKSLKENPTERHRPAPTLIVNALNEAYPCKN